MDLQKRYELYYSLPNPLTQIMHQLEMIYAVIYDALHKRAYQKQRDNAEKMRSLPSFYLGED